jgi:hypothetical protein
VTLPELLTTPEIKTDWPAVKGVEGHSLVTVSRPVVAMEQIAVAMVEMGLPEQSDVNCATAVSVSVTEHESAGTV